MITFFMSLKPFLDTKAFFSIGPPQPLENIMCVVANNMRGAADILHGQHQFFEIFLIVLGFSKAKLHFFPKVLKNWSSLVGLVTF